MSAHLPLAGSLFLNTRSEVEEKKTAAWIDFSTSPAYEVKYPGMAFGLTLISDCRPLSDSTGFEQYKRNLLRRMRKRETLASISQRIDVYDQFFQSFGFECPLPQHLKRTINSGFPRYNLMVDAHFMAEMCAGILVAVTDYDRIEGRLMLDISREGETSVGMGNRQFMMKEGEIVLRDEKDIICVLCQGADEKTKVRDDTRNVLFYSYAVPGIDGIYLKEGLTVAAQTMAQFGGGNIKGLDVLVKGSI
jgi:DNA/RNA-binding domain of Phe-tRNA-synthetase-like protein